MLHWHLEKMQITTLAAGDGQSGAIWGQSTDPSVQSSAAEVFVAIYEGAVPDAELSANEPMDGEGRQRTRYRNCLMIATRAKGDKDYTSVELTDLHKRQYPLSWGYFQNRQATRRRVLIDLLPGITQADINELHDLRIYVLDQLAEAEVPENLVAWRTMARLYLAPPKPRLRLVNGKLEEVA
jgi:hypothetical protein